jgi:PAS domain S-box-containing protein
LERKGEQQKEGTGMKILIADDNSNNLYMLEVLLKGAGYEVVMAKNGIEALEKIRASRFDGIVSDIFMPTMDGFRLIRECKKDPVLRQIPFIFYTATYTEKKDEEFGLSLGAIRYIIKPAEPEEILRQIHEAFIEHARSPRDFTVQPIPDEGTFGREYTRRVGAKLEKKERALQESEEKYRLLYENSMDALLFTSPDGSIQAANPAACSMFQRTEEEIIKTRRAGVIDTTDPRLSAALEERARTGRFKGELTFLRKDGTRFPGEVSTNIFTDRTGQKRSCMIIRDVTEQKKAKNTLLENEKFLSNIVEHIPDMIFVKDAQDLRFVRFNKAGEDLLGYSREELLGKNDYDFFPKPEADFFTENDKGVIHRNQLLDIPDEKIQTRHKGERILHTKKIPILDENGNPKYLLGISEDITERKKAEEQLKRFSEELEMQVAVRTEALNKSLHEKEILIKEVHHRVKNNMQIITSLLNLQARTIDDPVVLKTIKDSQSRIKAMALVHERLYRSGDISSINLKDYIQFLAKELFSFYGIKPQHIRFTINAPAIKVNIDTAIPLGLIVNELISNAIKYAFPMERKGEIVIDITKDKNKISLVVRDNGVGIPADFDWRNAKSLGLRLIISLVEQLLGTIELDRSTGTVFTIVVKEKE